MARELVIQRKSKSIPGIRNYLGRVFLEQKLNNRIGYFLMAVIAVGFGYLTARQPVAGIGIIGGLLGIVVMMVCLMNVMAGVYILVGYSFFIYYFSRLLFDGQFPIGIGYDALTVCIFLGLFIKKINWNRSINQFTRSQIGIWMLILFFYLFIELFNPSANSFDGWYMAFRKILGALLMLFVFYNVFTSHEAVRKFVRYLFILCVIAAFYGCVQQFHGFFNYEIKFVLEATPGFTADQIDPYYRKFSTFPDCSAFGIMMAAAAVFFTLIALVQKDKKIRMILLAGVIPMLMSMGFSGTRTANAMLVAGFFMYCLLTFHQKTTRIFSAVALVLLLFILYAPFYSNPTINRFRTTFNSEQDASYQLRESNRNFIQPYVRAHPIGGGLGTTGDIGRVWNPGHPLAGFMTDGSYLMKAAETGWIGLVIALLLYFAVLRRGVVGYFRSRSETTKLIYSASTAAIFAFYVGEYAQVAVSQTTGIIFYYPLIAILLRAEEFDLQA